VDFHGVEPDLKYRSRCHLQVGTLAGVGLPGRARHSSLSIRVPLRSWSLWYLISGIVTSSRSGLQSGGVVGCGCAWTGATARNVATAKTALSVSLMAPPLGMDRARER